MKAFLILPNLLAAATAAPQFFGGHAGLVRGAGQVSHQSVSKPFQGEHRSTVQSKAFGAAIASVSDSPNRLHGARGLIAHPVAHAFGHPAAHAIAHPVGHAFGHPAAHAIGHPFAHAIGQPIAPLVHSSPLIAHRPVIHAAPAIAHPVAVAHAPVYGHLAPAYGTPDLAEVSPYSYNYAVADDYSGAAFNQQEANDGNGVVQGSYSVNLPDGRVQTVNYHANDYDGFVSEVSYEGTPAYPETVAHPSVAHAPIVAHAPLLAHPFAHAVAPIAHGVALAHHGVGVAHLG